MKLLVTSLVIAVVLFFLGMTYGQGWLYQKKQWSLGGDDKQVFQDTIVKKLTAEEDLIVLKALVQTIAVFDKTWFGLDIFKKIHRVIFTGRGIFVVDLSEFDRSDLKIEKNKIYLSIGKPILNDIIIDLDKTKFETDQGYFRFGKNVSLTTEQNVILIQNAKESIRRKLSEQEYIKKAEEKSLESLKNLLQAIAGDHYLIIVNITNDS